MELVDSFSCSQQPATSPYPEPDEPNLQHVSLRSIFPRKQHYLAQSRFILAYKVKITLSLCLHNHDEKKDTQPPPWIKPRPASS
jgi:hypothetical protein